MTGSQSPACPLCNSEMVFYYGCQWDYDRWMCTKWVSRLELCSGEIELDTTTTPEEMEPKMKTLNQARQEAGHDWERAARVLSMKCREYGEDPLYAHRLWRLRKGHTRPRPYELKALWDCYKVDSYKDE